MQTTITKIFCRILLAGSLIHSNSSLSATENQLTTLYLATPIPVSNIHGKWAKAVFNSALRELGFELTIRQCEPMLCTKLAKLGEVDGELLRYAGYQSRVPTLIRVAESPFPTVWSAFSTDSELKLQSWQQIRDGNLKIGYLTGVPYLEQNLNTEKTRSRLFKVRHWQIGLNDLQTGKIDLYIGADQIISPYIKNPTYSSIYRAGIISSIPLYVYLNPKYHRLATDLAANIAKMKSTGQIDEIYQTIFLQQVQNP